MLVLLACLTRRDAGGLPLAIAFTHTSDSVFVVSLGAVGPLLMNRLQIAPAMSFGPVLTTLTDMISYRHGLTLSITTWDIA